MVEKGQGTASVMVVGGGIAGLTAAVNLVDRGYDVTILERDQFLGGNVGAHTDHQHPENPEFYDVYPHMFATFYANFWKLVEHVGIDREESFAARESVKIKRRTGEYVSTTNVASLKNAWRNFVDGPEPPADMLISMYGMLDLLSRRRHRRALLEELSVNGFLSARPYITDRAADLHDFILGVVWSARSYAVAASAYTAFFRYGLRTSSPLLWVLKGDLHTCLIAPIQAYLERRGVRILTGHEVTRIEVGHHARITRVVAEEWEWDYSNPAPPKSKRAPAPHDDDLHEFPTRKVIDTHEFAVEHLVLAASPRTVGNVAQAGDAGTRMVDWIPEFSKLRQARAEPIAVLTLQFRDRIPEIPPEHISLDGSPMDLSILDLSQAWTDLGADGDGEAPTVLTIAASNYYGLPAAAGPFDGEHSDIVAMVSELERYFPQIENHEIDWEKSHFHMNTEAELFINDVASEAWRPGAYDARIPNLYLCGGYCRNDVGMATVEGAVMTGLHAAQRVVERTESSDEVAPVEVIRHEAYPEFVINGMKLAMMPAAYWAKAWVSMTGYASEGWSEGPGDLGREVSSLWALPAHFMMDAWETGAEMYWSYWDFLLGRRG